MTNFFSYVTLVLHRAVSDWGEWLWENFLKSAITGIVLFAIALILYPRVIALKPSWKETLEGPMNSLASAVFGILTVAVLAFIVFLIFLALAPPRIYFEQQELIRRVNENLAERDATIAAKDAELTARGPRILCDIRTAYIFDAHPAQMAPGSTNFLVNLFVQNSGDPSILRDWRMAVITDDGKRHDAIVALLPKFEVRIRMPDGSMTVRTIEHSELIVNKALTPIPSGGGMAGFLLASCRSLPIADLESGDLQIAVGCTDVTGKYWESSGSKTDIIKNPIHYFLPGDAPTWDNVQVRPPKSEVVPD